MKGVLDAVSYQEFDYAVEFGHRNWLDESKKEIDAATLVALKEKNVASALIDGPGLHVGSEQTADHAYSRFHGRNYDIWYKEEKEDDHRLDRYDYLYKRDQLEPWVPQIKKAELKESKNENLLQQPRQGQISQERLSLDGYALSRAQAKGDQATGPVYTGGVLGLY